MLWISLCPLAVLLTCVPRSDARTGNAVSADGFNYIVGGIAAEPNEFPWQSSLQVNYKDSFWSKPLWEGRCGASIIKDKWLITAAHCIVKSAKISDYRIVAGSLDLFGSNSPTVQIAKLAEIIPHPEWDISTVSNDIALIKLQKPLKIGPAVFPISLPGTEDQDIFDHRVCVVSGWGAIAPKGPSSEVLFKTFLPVVPNSQCAVHYRHLQSVRITTNKMCAGRLETAAYGPCSGDSGGPLACFKDHSFVLAGITSFTAACDSGDYPSVFTRLSSYEKWINSVISSH